MSEALQNLVGLKDHCDPADTSGLYFDDLAGIDTQSLADLRSMDKRTVDAVFKGLEREAIKKVKNKIRGELGTSFQSATRENYSTGRFKGAGNDPYPLKAELSGKVIKLDKSRYLSALIRSVELYYGSTVPEGSTVDRDLYLYDTYTGELIETISVSFTKFGIHEFPINKRYLNKGIYLCYDASQVQGIPTFRENTRYNLYECNCGFGGQSGLVFDISNDPPAEGWRVYEDSLSSGNTGMVIHYEVECSFDAYLAESKADLAEAIRYAMGIEFWTQTYFGSQITPTTLLPKETRNAEISRLRGNLKSELNAFFKTVDLSDICFCEPEGHMESYHSTP